MASFLLPFQPHRQERDASLHPPPQAEDGDSGGLHVLASSGAAPSDRQNPSTQTKFFRKFNLKKYQFWELSLVVAGLGPDDRLLAAKLLIDVCFPAF